MEYSKTDLSRYVESLYDVDNFEDAFNIFEDEVLKLGYHGVLYTYIPKVLINSNFSSEPVYVVSKDYSPHYLGEYTRSRFDKYDPLIKAVNDGVSTPISWWGDICKSYMEGDQKSYDVIAASKDHGIQNGLTLPLMSGSKGIAGASFISEERKPFNKLIDHSLLDLKLCTTIFHNMVASNALYMSQFSKTLLESLNDTEKRFLMGLASGKSPAQIAVEINRNEKYLEQVMLRIRRKLSGVGSEETPLINRNQVLYYAGLLNILEFSK